MKTNGSLNSATNVERFKILKSYKHILFCFPHANSLGLVRSIAKGGLDPIVVSIDPQLSDNGFYHSKYIKECYRFSTPEQGMDFIIDKFGKDSHKNFLYLMPDFGIRICDERYDELKDKFYFFNSGGANRLSPYLNKDCLCELADKCGLPVPKYEIVKRGSTPRNLTYPIFIKTNNSFANWKSDAGIVYNEEELKETCNKFRSDEWIMQNYIDKKAEYSWQGISVNGGEQVYMPYRKKYIRLRKNDYGTYMCYEAIQPPQNIGQGIKTMLQKMNFSGCFEAEFIVDHQEGLHFLEINPRFSASNQGMFAGGVNLPLEWALSVVKGKIEQDEISLVNRPYYVVNEFLDFRSQVLTGKISIFQWINDVKNSSCFYHYEKNDKAPFYCGLKMRLLRFIKRRF